MAQFRDRLETEVATLIKELDAGDRLPDEVEAELRILLEKGNASEALRRLEEHLQ